MSVHEELDPNRQPEEATVEVSLRPRYLAEFIGQDSIKSNLKVFLSAAQMRKETLDHLLLYGPPGLGKTTLAHIVANEMQTTAHVTSGPTLQIPGDLAGILTNLEPGSVLFIDEIHRLPRPVEEVLYLAMEDRRVDIMIGKGPAARSIRLDVPPVTVVGATTRQGLLTGPLRDRFGIVMHFEFYDDAALYHIVERSSRLLGYVIEDDGAREIARRARGTPRIANRLLRRVRDFATVDGLSSIGLPVVEKALAALEIDAQGLDRLDRAYLRAIVETHRGGPVGLETLAASLGEDSATLEDVIEPFLLQRGMLSRTPRGRTATPDAARHLGLRLKPRSDDGQLDL